MISTKQSTFRQQWLSDLLILTGALCLFYVLWLGGHALFTPDEGRYSEVAREMIASGDYITPRVDGVAFLDKPILYYWLQASAIRLFGLNEWSLRFWPALAGVIGCLVTYISGRIIYNRRTAILAALFLATSPLYYGAAHYANMDLEVAAWVGSSLLCFIAAMQLSGRPRMSFLLAAYIFASFAFLTKGLIGIVFPGMIIGCWILFLNRWNTLKSMLLVPGLLLFTCLVAPWYILVQKANPEFLHFFFVTQQVSRFLTQADFNNKAVFWFYVPIILVGFFPWSVFAIQTLYQKIKVIIQNRQQHSVDAFLVIWFTIVFIFFSIPKSKTVGYILPLFPALALMTSSSLNLLCDKMTRSLGVRIGLNLFTLSCLLLSALLFSLPHLSLSFIRIYPETLPFLAIGGSIYLVAGIVNLIITRKQNIPLFILLALVTSVCSLITLTASTDAFNQKSIKPLAMQIKSLIRPQDEVVSYHKYYQDLPLYLERRITIVADWQSPEIPRYDNWMRELWYGMIFQDTRDWLINDALFWQRWNSNNHLYVFTNTSDVDELKTKSPHVFVISRYKQTALVSNQPVQIHT